MAGPGGGPPRRSHTKSRKGCDQCKKRHIRCDETFPQCLNCTKHKSRCPYNDISETRSTTPDKPDLMWTPEIEAVIANWRATGEFPFPGMGVSPAPKAADYSLEELRLIHHVAYTHHKLETLGAVEFTIWVKEIPKIIRLGAVHRHVMDALLAFSASHMAHLTTCSHVGNMALAFRGTAINGLSQAIASFSRETSDAILAASMVLSWQETNWRSWTQLMDGTASVMNAMKDWQHESQFLDFIKESSTFPALPSSAMHDRKPKSPEPADLESFATAQARVQKVESYLKSKRQDSKLVQQLVTFMKAARRVPPSRSTEEQFERLRDLRTWLFWLPVGCIEDTQGAPNTLVILALYYSVALLAERIFTGIGAAYFGSLSMGPIEHISRRIFDLAYECPEAFEEFKDQQEFMRFPLETLTEFRAKFHRDTLVEFPPEFPPRMGWCQSPPCSIVSLSPFCEPAQAVVAGGGGSGGGGAVAVALGGGGAGSIYGENPAFSYSTEDLASLNTESAPASVISPLSLSSPFPGHQYLGIPSPSYPATAYSPASSTFEGALSDTEDYSVFDLSGFSAGSPTTYDTAAFDASVACEASSVQKHRYRHSFGGITPASTPAMTFPPDAPVVGFHLDATPVFLQPEQAGMLPLPGATLAGAPSLGHRRHYSSTASLPVYHHHVSADEWCKEEQ